MDTAAFAFGVLASFVAWLLVATVMRPKLQWARDLERTDFDADAVPPRLYTARFRNRRRLRSAMDVCIKARVRIRGLRPGFAATWATFEVPCDSATIPRLRPAMHKLGGKWQYVSLRLSEIEPHDLHKLPGPLRESLARGDGELESLFDVGEEAEVYFTVTCEDGFSGVRRVFVSPRFTEVSRRVAAR